MNPLNLVLKSFPTYSDVKIEFNLQILLKLYYLFFIKILIYWFYWVCNLNDFCNFSKVEG